MAMTPLVRYKNMSFENFKKFLKMYPYIADDTTWNNALANFDFQQIGSHCDGYKKTAYQFACQIGIENKGNNYFEINNYLFKLDDDYLKKYLQFWMLTYYAPNPYVKSSDKSKIIWVELCEKLLESSNLEIDYYQYFHDNINEAIDVTSGANAASSDILKNALIEHGIFLKIKSDNRTIYVEKEDEQSLKEKVESIKKTYPIPTSPNDKAEFFNRYSFENFSKLFPKQVNPKNYKNISVELEHSNFKIKDLIFENADLIETQVNKALKSGKNIILTGPPGTGKSKLAKQICESFNVEYRMTTAIADWSTYETIGGYKMNKDSSLYFDEGVFLSCFKDSKNEVKNEWLIIDEMNRADIDKAFGVFFSALTGDNINLSFKADNDKNVELINERNITSVKDIEPHQYLIPKDWRMIGIINTSDKASLFEMSYAFMRRFAFIPVPIPKKIDESMIQKYLKSWGITNNTIGDLSLASGLTVVWKIINKYKPIGPAILRDIAAYVETENDWASAIILYVLPQFEGIEDILLQNFVQELESSEIKALSDQKHIINSFIEDFFAISF